MILFNGPETRTNDTQGYMVADIQFSILQLVILGLSVTGKYVCLLMLFVRFGEFCFPAKVITMYYV